ARQEIGLVGAGHQLLGKEAAVQENRGFEAVFHRRKYHSEGRPHADAHIADLAAVDVGTRLQVVERPTDVLRLLDQNLAAHRAYGRIVARWPFVGALVHRVQYGATALDHIIDKLHVAQRLAVRAVQHSGAGKKHDRLIRRFYLGRQEQISRNAFVAVSRVEG